MSRGLGWTQRRLLSILATFPRGHSIAELAELLDVPERRTRKVVDSLVERGLVIAHRRPGSPTQVWLFDYWRQHANAEHHQALQLAQVLRWANPDGVGRDFRCPNCGWHGHEGV